MVVNPEAFVRNQKQWRNFLSVFGGQLICLTSFLLEKIEGYYTTSATEETMCPKVHSSKLHQFKMPEN
jgi:hypothetical protein